MKIIVVTMAKNEENLIESFVRHALSFADSLVIYNHNSTDGTADILNELKKEFGDRIILWTEEKTTLMIINQEVFERMTSYAFRKLNADMVMPLDADEFPLGLDKKDVRKYLVQLDKTKCYRVHFMPFTIAKEWRNDVFAPILFERRKKINCNTDYKMILQREPYFYFGLQLSLGNHFVSATKHMEEEVPVIDLFPELFYAHYPFRNKAHLENKLILRQLALAMRPDVDVTTAFQYVKGFEQILNGQSLSDEDVAWYCLNNMCNGYDQVETLDEIQASIEWVDPKELFEVQELKYTERFAMNKTNYRTLLEFADQLAGQYSSQSKKLIAYGEENAQQKETIKQLRNEIILYKNSTSWKITEPLRKIMKIIKH